MLHTRAMIEGAAYLPTVDGKCEALYFSPFVVYCRCWSVDPVSWPGKRRFSRVDLQQPAANNGLVNIRSARRMTQATVKRKIQKPTSSVCYEVRYEMSNSRFFKNYASNSLNCLVDYSVLRHLYTITWPLPQGLIVWPLSALVGSLRIKFWSKETQPICTSTPLFICTYNVSKFSDLHPNTKTKTNTGSSQLFFPLFWSAQYWELSLVDENRYQTRNKYDGERTFKNKEWEHRG